jgi:hypothetical protein
MRLRLSATFKVTLGRGEDETNAQKTEWSFRVFEDDGDAEEYVKWRIRFEELAEAMSHAPRHTRQEI